MVPRSAQVPTTGFRPRRQTPLGYAREWASVPQGARHGRDPGLWNLTPLAYCAVAYSLPHPTPFAFAVVGGFVAAQSGVRNVHANGTIAMHESP